MPLVTINGAPVRARPMLDALGAQEALEAHGRYRYALHPMVGEARIAAHERERLALARRRNATERKLRPAEHATWAVWRSADAAGRAAVRAMLTTAS